MQRAWRRAAERRGSVCGGGAGGGGKCTCDALFKAVAHVDADNGVLAGSKRCGGVRGVEDRYGDGLSTRAVCVRAAGHALPRLCLQSMRKKPPEEKKTAHVRFAAQHALWAATSTGIWETLFGEDVWASPRPKGKRVRPLQRPHDLLHEACLFSIAPLSLKRSKKQLSGCFLLSGPFFHSVKHEKPGIL